MFWACVSGRILYISKSICIGLYIIYLCMYRNYQIFDNIQCDCMSMVGLSYI